MSTWAEHLPDPDLITPCVCLPLPAPAEPEGNFWGIILGCGGPANPCGLSKTSWFFFPLPGQFQSPGCREGASLGSRAHLALLSPDPGLASSGLGVLVQGQGFAYLNPSLPLLPQMSLAIWLLTGPLRSVLWAWDCSGLP